MTEIKGIHATYTSDDELANLLSDRLSADPRLIVRIANAENLGHEIDIITSEDQGLSKIDVDAQKCLSDLLPEDEAKSEMKREQNLVVSFGYILVVSIIIIALLAGWKTMKESRKMKYTRTKNS
jgi:hypothetical protein